MRTTFGRLSDVAVLLRTQCDDIGGGERGAPFTPSPTMIVGPCLRPRGWRVDLLRRGALGEHVVDAGDR
ncbi:MAG: hypothetical protein U0W40_06545 [Acidimicrobiia bacterium]